MAWGKAKIYHKLKTPEKSPRGLKYSHEKQKLICNSKLQNYFFFSYFLLNLSIRPAVSTSIFLPVKKGWEVLDISSFTRGYSLPSSHFTVSLLTAVERLKKAWPLLMSLNTTKRYPAG